MSTTDLSTPQELYLEPSEWLVALSRDASLAEQAIVVAQPYCLRSPVPLDWALVLALAFWHSDKYSDGIAVLDRIPHQQIRNGNYFGLLGMLCRQLPGQEERAKCAYARALELEPERSDHHYNFANLLKDAGDPRQALVYYRSSLRLSSSGADVWHNYGSTLNEEGQHLAALRAMQVSLRLKPINADAWCNLGLTYFHLGHFDACFACFRKSIALDRQHIKSHINFGGALLHDLQPNYALKMLHRGVQLDSSSANSLWNCSLVLLLLGQYSLGWRYYEARLHTEEFATTKPPTKHDLPRNLSALPSPGEDELLVWSEQGMGDSIQFCRYLPLLQARQVPFHLLVPELLLRFYRDWLGLGDGVSAKLKSTPDVEARFNIPLMSLPLLFDTQLHNIPSSTPYIKAPSLPPPHLQVPRPSGGLAVGVVWATNPENRKMYRHKSIPPELLIPPLIDLIDLDLIELHSLQVGADAQKLSLWQPQERLIDWSQVLGDFSDTAHVINQLDLVISVDTAVAHLAGALNKPTWLLLPYNADFRWLYQRDDSPWYPTMRLFRQQARDNWRSVMTQVQDALDGLFLFNLQALASAKLRR